MAHEIVPVHLAVQAMRDNGYKNAAYAIAELIDNSIQAGASSVQILCGEREVVGRERAARALEEVAVLDNGSGMNESTLRAALQFGNGSYLDPDNHTGMGRYGMGLPSASISQCMRVDVWTWTNGVENAIHTFLDLDQIKKKALVEVPEPKSKKIPSVWKCVGKDFGGKGTLVVWSKIDRCIWRKASAVIRNSELLIGRMYRKFIAEGKASIRMVAFDLDNPASSEEKFASPNDPGYLIENTSCPPPFNNQPMFELYSQDSYPIKSNGKLYDVVVTYSYAKEVARSPQTWGDAGGTPHGKHAAKNLGVSIVRAGRELDLDTAIVVSHDVRERWWGVEVEFPPALDEIMGVTNNKQAARNLSEVLKLDFKDYCKQEDASPTEMLQRMREDGDPRGDLIVLVESIKKQLSVIRGMLKTQTAGSRANIRGRGDNAAAIATGATKERQESGHIGASDTGEQASIAEREGQVKQQLEEMGCAPEAISSIIDSTFRSGRPLKYIFAHADIESPAFFTVKPKGGELIISLNTNHPAYDKLFEVLEVDGQEEDIESLRSHLMKAREALKLLFMAWARYEDEQPDGTMRTAAQQVRYDWGTIAKGFLEAK